jgi:hypothetical protein
MEPESSLFNSQEPATCVYPEPDQSSQRPPNCSLSPRHGASSGCGWRRRPADMEGNGHATGGGPPAWGLGEGLTTPRRKKRNVLRN